MKKKIVTFIGLLWFATFWSFWVSSIYLKGDAINGKAEGGRFFLSFHGKLTEVSKAVYDFSYAHAVALFVLTFLAIIASLVDRSLVAKNSSSGDSSVEMKWLNRTTILMIIVAIAYTIFRPGL